MLMAEFYLDQVKGPIVFDVVFQSITFANREVWENHNGKNWTL